MDNLGRVLGGRYRLLEQIGKGGMGSVWRAEHLELGSHCAVKLIDEDLAESTMVRARFRREAKAAAALSSDHVVRTFDYGVDDGTPYIAMELLTGESLDQRIKRVGRLSANELAELLAQVALALERAHRQGLVHRDLKPGNLFVAKSDNGRDCVKLLDFGIAKSLRSDDDLAVGPTRTGSMVGSPAYMSPEQLRNAAGIDPASDLWSLGVVAYEALVGQRPFIASSMADLTLRICVDALPVPSSVTQVPRGFDDWFFKACNRDTKARFSTATELAQAFQALLVSEVSDATLPASQPGLRSVDVSHSSSSLHLHSTGPLARTANDATRSSSPRSYWLLAGVGVVAVATVWFRSRTPIVTPGAASAPQSAEAAHVASRPSPTVSGFLDDAGPMKATIRIEPREPPVTPLPASGGSLETSNASRSAPQRTATGKRQAPHTPNPNSEPKPNALAPKLVPDSVYGF